MKVLVTGAKGQLGFDVMRELRRQEIAAIGVDFEEMDITDAGRVDEVLGASGADAVIHCAAYTAVDAAQENEALCRRINRDGTANIATACKRLGMKMLYISTDYVFDGEGERPWETDDERHPLNVYGQTKYEGELAVQERLKQYFIVRISWVFGVNGKNFVKTMLDLAKTHEHLTVVDDQFGSPTYTYDLAKLLVEMVQTEKYGIYHATNEGICSWYAFACEIFRQVGIFRGEEDFKEAGISRRAGNFFQRGKDVRVEAVRSDAFPVRARRPHNSRMDKAKLESAGFSRLPRWEDALGRYLKELGEV